MTGYSSSVAYISLITGGIITQGYWGVCRSFALMVADGLCSSGLFYLLYYIGTLYDHKTNNSIRQELWITSILDKIVKYRKKWLLHIQRIPQNWIPLKSFNYRPQGRR
jgi:NADH:ubiquinone oxidoreductase subunit 4 (subunit M)